MTNLSEGGLAFKTERELDPKTKLSMDFTLIGRDGEGRSRITPMKVRGEVIHNNKRSKKEYEIGVKITKIDDGHKEAIISFVKGKNG